MSLVVGIRFFPDSSMFQYSIKENGLPRRFAPRNDSGWGSALFLLHSAPVSALATPQSRLTPCQLP